MSMYETGTVSATADATTITGSGTKWADQKNGIGPQCTIAIYGAGTVDLYAIARVDSDTQLTVTRPVSRAFSGAAYGVMVAETQSVQYFANMLAAQLGYYQSQMDGWQEIMTGTGSVTITAPDGRQVTISSFKKLTEDMAGKAGLNTANTFTQRQTLAQWPLCFRETRGSQGLSGLTMQTWGGTGIALRTEIFAMKGEPSSGTNRANIITADITDFNAGSDTSYINPTTKVTIGGKLEAQGTITENASPVNIPARSGMGLAWNDTGGGPALSNSTSLATGMYMGITDNVGSPIKNAGCGLLQFNGNSANYRTQFVITDSGGGRAFIRATNQNVFGAYKEFTTSAVSDKRLKNIESELNLEQALSNIDKMEFKNFTFLADATKTDRETGEIYHVEPPQRRGVISQQIQEIDPQYVKEIGGYLHLDQTPMLLDALAAIKALKRRDEQNSERIAALEGEIRKLQEVGTS